MAEVPTPSLDKMISGRDKSQAVGEFLDWLGEQGIVLARWQDPASGALMPMARLRPHGEDVESLLARFFEVDLAAAEREKRALLAATREIKPDRATLARRAGLAVALLLATLPAHAAEDFAVAGLSISTDRLILAVLAAGIGFAAGWIRGRKSLRREVGRLAELHDVEAERRLVAGKSATLDTAGRRQVLAEGSRFASESRAFRCIADGGEVDALRALERWPKKPIVKPPPPTPPPPRWGPKLGAVALLALALPLRADEPLVAPEDVAEPATAEEVAAEILRGPIAPKAAGTCGTHGGQCSQRCPARVPPACVRPDGSAVACTDPAAIPLWPPRLRPGEATIPPERDSSCVYQGACAACSCNGFERFYDVEADGSTLFVATNSGFLAFDVSAGRPRALFAVDGWKKGAGGKIESSGLIPDFPAPSEQLNIFRGVATLSLGPDRTLVALAGASPVGLVLFERNGNAARLVGRDDAPDAMRVRLARTTTGVYLVVGTNTTTVLYRVGASLEVERVGPLPHQGGYVAVVADGPGLLLAGSRGMPGERLRVYRVNPAAGSSELYRGDVGPGGRALAWMQTPVGLRLAVVRGPRLEVHALDGDHPEIPEWSIGVRPAPGDELMRVSGSPRVVLSYGAVSQAPVLTGPAYERLLDVTAYPTVVDLAAGGGTYVDPCSGRVTDYLSAVYEGTGPPAGTNLGIPGVCVAAGDHLYCADGGVFRWHRIVAPMPPPPPPPPPATPEIFRSGFETGDLSEWSGKVGAQ